MAGTNTNKFNMILIIRNDRSQKWETTEYCLEKGELGIEFFDKKVYDDQGNITSWEDTGKVIVRVGVDGKTPWKDCPKVEGVFEEDLQLTYTFGKYSPDTSGSFTLECAGKSMSEVMLDAFAEEDFGLSANKPLITGRPTASMTISGGKTGEVGESYTNDIQVTLTINPAGSYRYGAKDAEGKPAGTNIAFTTANIRPESKTATAVKTISDVNGSNQVIYSQDVSDNILAEGSKTYTFYGEAAYGKDANRPLTNLGNFYKMVDGKPVATKKFEEAVGEIQGGTALSIDNSGAKKTVTYKGYRRLFMGRTTVTNPTIDSTFLRGEKREGASAAELVIKQNGEAKKGTYVVAAEKDDIALYYSYPETLATKNSDGTYKTPTFEYFIANEWKPLAGPVKIDNVNVEGAGHYEAKAYTVYKYTPNDGYFASGMQTRITIN